MKESMGQGMERWNVFNRMILYCVPEQRTFMIFCGCDLKKESFPLRLKKYVKYIILYSQNFIPYQKENE